MSRSDADVVRMTSSPSPSSETRPRVVAGLALAVLTASVGTSAANVALPALVEVFGATTNQVQWVVVAYLLGMTATSVVVGALGDRRGRRTVLRWGLVVFVVAGVVAAIAPALLVLVIARGVQGAGAAVMTALPLAIARDVSATGRTGRVMGLLGTTSAVGTALGPALGGVLVGVSGWSAPFWIMVLLALAALVLSSTRRVRTICVRPHGRSDGVGGVLLTLAIGAYALALTAPGDGWPVVPLLLGAAALLLAFVVVERRAAAPLLPVAAMRSRTVTIGMLCNLLVATVMMTTLVVGPFALHDGLGLAPALVGLVMATGPAVSAVSGVLAGRIVDRTSARATTTVGLALMTVGATALGVFPSWWGVAGYVGALIVLTPGYQLFLAANNTQAMQGAAPSHRGTVAGLLGLSRNLGLVTGASAMGGLYASVTTGTGGADPAHLDAMRLTFLVAAALAAIAAASSLLMTHGESSPGKAHA